MSSLRHLTLDKSRGVVGRRTSDVKYPFKDVKLKNEGAEEGVSVGRQRRGTRTERDLKCWDDVGKSQ